MVVVIVGAAVSKPVAISTVIS